MTARCQVGLSYQQVQAAILNAIMIRFYRSQPADTASMVHAALPGGHARGLLQACRAAWVVLFAWALCGLALAAGEDPPGRVGRVSLVAGSTDLIAEPGTDWAPAALNMPMATGTALRTAAQSRAEVRIGSTSLQLNANSELHVQALDDQSIVLVLGRGNIALNLRELAAGERVEVHVDEAAFAIVAPGSYHFGHAPGLHRFEAKVFAGAGNFVSPAATAPVQLTTGQQAQLDPRTLAVTAQGDAQRTRFDDWAAQRSNRVAAGGYVSPEMTGAEELDAHGRWRVEPRVGAVWYPTSVDADWAPYRAGRWAWVAPWGWTWIDDAPWGFAPFHYGRWLFLAGRWGWVPGSYVARPVFAPALVGFYDGAGVATAPWVGWFPLAPGEVYRPGFAASARFAQRVNVGIVAAPAVGAGSYRYAQTSFAATAMSRESFGAAPAAGAARVPLTPAQLSGAGVLATHGAPTPAPALAPAAPRNFGAEARLPAAVPQGAESPDARRGQAMRARSGERRAAAERAAQVRQSNKALNAGAAKAQKPRAPVAEHREFAHPNRP